MTEEEVQQKIRVLERELAAIGTTLAELSDKLQRIERQNYGLRETLNNHFAAAGIEDHI